MGQTEIEDIPAKTLIGQKRILSDLGVSFTDIFGATAILWVEGPTEVGVFGQLLEHIPYPKGIEILSMPNASAVDRKKHINAFFDLHDSVSQGTSLWPSIARFSFDTENRTDARLQELSKRSGKRIDWLPAKMIECYFLNPSALAALLSHRDEKNNYQDTDINDWMKKNDYDLTLDKNKNLNAAKILKTLFSELTETRYQYNKIEDGYWLTEWFLRNRRDDLSELIDYVASIMDTMNTEVES